MISFNEYQEAALGMAIYPNRGNNIAYPTLGLAGETGEVAEKVKKIIRDNGGIINDEHRAAIRKELGDVLWYVAATADEFGLKLNDIAEANINKLQSRKDRGVLGGSGDER